MTLSEARAKLVELRARVRRLYAVYIRERHTRGIAVLENDIDSFEQACVRGSSDVWMLHSKLWRLRYRIANLRAASRLPYR